MRALNEHVLEIVRSTPRGGGYGWPAQDPTVGGCLESVFHDGVCVLRAGPGPTPPVYCCGVTLEALFRAFSLAGAVPPIDARTARRLQRRWFVIGPKYRKGPANALPRYGLGIETSDDPQPGDFAQLWRENGSGHSVVVLDYDKEENRLRYWSAQRSTDGIGICTEHPHELFAARVILPA